MTRIAVAGAGLIGTRHVDALRLAGISVHSVIDPDPSAADIAARHGVPHHVDLAAALATRPDGVILSTPNTHHRDGALACIAAGVPVLVEKPLAATVEDARAIVAAGQAAGVPVLTGHYRRHQGVVAAARERIEAGALGTPVAAHAMFWIAKPDGYFDTAWRRAPGAGPLLVNLIHDLDLLRFLLGEVESVRAIASDRVRGFENEDHAAALIAFESGLICTAQISDAIVAPWSWEMTSHDNPAYPPTDQNALWIGGTHGSLALPRGELWDDGGRRDWMAPIRRETLTRATPDPLVAQARNFADVIAGRAAPVCSGAEGLATLAALDALIRATRSGGVEWPTP